MILNSDYALNIAKAIWVIYNNYPIFTKQMQNTLCKYFLQKGFIKLFLHWSWNVRIMFYHFLYYRIHYTHVREMSGEEANQSYEFAMLTQGNNQLVVSRSTIYPIKILRIG